jgi:hypothetical protein
MPILGTIDSAKTGRLTNPAFESISTVYLSSGSQSTIDFTSIPSTYKHLQLRLYYICSTSPGTVRLKVGTSGSISSTSYSYHDFKSNGTTPTGYVAAPNNVEAYILLDSQNTGTNVGVIDFLDYSNTNKATALKSFFGSQKLSTGGTENHIGFSRIAWVNTATITNIQFYTQSGSFNQYSHFALYGLKGA